MPFFRSWFSQALAIIALLFVTIPVPATGRPVWGIEQDEFRSRLANGSYRFLQHINFSRYDLDELLRLGGEAPYLLALIFDELELTRVASDLLELGWQQSPEPWRRFSVLDLLSRLSELGLYRELERLSREAVAVYEEPPTVRYLVESLYRQQRDQEALRWLERLEQLMDQSDPPESELVQEMALWRAVIGSRMGSEGWPDLYRSVYRDYPASEVHSRIWEYLQARPKIRSVFSLEDLLFFRAKQLLAEGLADEALALFTDLVESNVPQESNLLVSPHGLLELYRAGLAAGEYRDTAVLFETISHDLPDELARRAFEYTGRLYRLAGALSTAEFWLERSLVLHEPGLDEQRVRWYLMSVLADLDPVRLARSLGGDIPLSGEPDYFSDVLGELSRRLVALGEWEKLLQSYRSIQNFATAGTLARYELALAAAYGAGLMEQTDTDGNGDAGEYLSRAASQREDLFAAIVASVLLGEDGVEALGLVQASENAGDGRPIELGIDEEVLDGFLRYGLLSRSFDLSVERSTTIRPELLRRVVVALAANDRLPQSIRLAGILAESSNGELPRDVAELLYPTAFGPLVADAARSESIDSWLFFGLVREESRFDPDVQSPAGAVGLTQLLPATADDIAGRMRIPTPDLSDPAGNLTLGARYLSMLTEQFGDRMKALTAYNGGQGRVRQWERRWPDYQGLLFHLAVPFEETHNHLRKVVVSASYYGYLYDDRVPSETVRLVFPLF